jgi:S-adenosylmethionine:diacylglycerol 3-amino-3-carboxypropyl transferase
MLLRKAREYRLEEAKDQCEMFHRTGHRNLPTNEYYRYFKQQMDKFLDKDITDIDWLKEKSKIFVLLVEEAKYRKLEISTETKEKTTYSINPRRIFSNIYKGRVSNNSNTNTSTSYSLWA